MKNRMDGPIPGANYTSDTKNYPWHRPPEHTDLDEAIEASFKKLTDEDASTGLLTMIEMGMDIASITDMFVTSGIGAGKWTPDFAILLAGPVSHIIYTMAKAYGLECDLGIYDKKKPITKSFFDVKKKINEAKAVRAADSVDLELIQEQAATMKTGGFMGMSHEATELPKIEQAEEGSEEEIY